MREPADPRPIEPGGRLGGQLWLGLGLGLLLIVFLAVAYASGEVPTVLFWAVLAGGISLLVVARGARARREREAADRGLGGEGEPEDAGSEELSGILWTVLWVAFVVFDEAILARLADLLAWLLDPFGLPPEETAETLEGVILSLAAILMLWSWIAGWRQRRRERRQAAEELD